jgi:hypothetical protein
MVCSAELGATRRQASTTVGARIKCIFAMLVLIVGGLGGVASAQEAAGDDEPQVFDFEEDEISTDYLKPNTMMVEGLRRGRMSSLISVRLHFVDEIVRSAEDI